jgi:hypothetical protein
MLGLFTLTSCVFSRAPEIDLSEFYPLPSAFVIVNDRSTACNGAGTNGSYKVRLLRVNTASKDPLRAMAEYLKSKGFSQWKSPYLELFAAEYRKENLLVRVAVKENVQKMSVRGAPIFPGLTAVTDQGQIAKTEVLLQFDKFNAGGVCQFGPLGEKIP